MSRLFIFMTILICLAFGQTMIVRVYANSRQELARISPKCDIDIAAARAGEWYDIVADRQVLSQIITSGLAYEILINDLEYEKEQHRANYLSYDEVNDSLQTLVQTYPGICKLDSLPIPTYEGHWIYGIKISDLPYIEEDEEPGLLVDGTHHAREWACPIVILFFADSLLRAYGVEPEITEIINTTEIYCFPIINADGYVYDYPAGYSWRKNREPFGGTIGNDPNRNYAGCSGDLQGDWGAADEYQTSHNPIYEDFCGAYVYSGDEIRALTLYVKTHCINAQMSYHSYGEAFYWGWGWTTQGLPDSLLVVEKGNYIASLIQCLYGGTYTPGQGPVISYATSGEAIDWVYSYNHYVNGISCLTYLTELGTTFYQPANNLNHICHQNFKALKYMAGFVDSIVLLCEGVVPPPDIYHFNIVLRYFTIAWHAKNASDNHPNQWELVELSNPSIVEDDLESGTSRWTLQGFSLSTGQAHSGTHSLFSGYTNEMNSAVQSAHPYLVEQGDSLVFWCWYVLDEDYDVAVAEVSENTKEWYCLADRFTGNSGGWVRKSYSLESWVGKSVFVRFRMMTDAGGIFSGFYVDDIFPVCYFQNVNTISSTITDTSYTFSNHPLGEYYYYVKGNNATWGWGDYSCLAKVNVVTAIAERISESLNEQFYLSVSPNPFTHTTNIRYMIHDTRYKTQEANQNISESVGRISEYQKPELKIYDAIGKLVKDFRITPDAIHTTLSWDGRDDQNRPLSSGVYFLKFKAGDYVANEKLILLQ